MKLNKKDILTQKIGDLCHLQQGLQVNKSERLSEKKENSHIYITIDFLKRQETYEYIENPRSSVMCNEEDILVSRTGTVGNIVSGVNGVFHNNFFKLILNNNCHKKFIYYYLKSKKIKEEMIKRANGAVIPDLKHSEFLSIKFPVLDLENQIKSAEYIEKMDENLNFIKKLLEKIEIRNQYYADKLLNGELTIENNRLVTNNNNKKNQTIKITDHIDIINGYPFKSNEMKNEGKYAVIKMSNFKESKVSTLKNTVYTDNLVNKAQLMKNDLLIGLSGSVGEFAIFNLNEICLLNQRCIILRNKNDDIGDYVKTYIINKVLEDLKNSSEGGVIKNVSSNFFQDMEIILPLEYKEIMLFINKTNEEKEKVEKLLKLEEQRFEWLSDKLLSGEYIIED